MSLQRSLQVHSRIPYYQARRAFTVSCIRLRPTSGPPFDYNRPAPPRLPKDLQEEFEQLQRDTETSTTGNIDEQGNELHPDMRKSTKAEFTGEKNPVTGEVGGPKTEPTRHGDWSFGGRASDF
jgi:hypothetical protein